jgi:hypothetical protein
MWERIPHHVLKIGITEEERETSMLIKIFKSRERREREREWKGGRERERERERERVCVCVSVRMRAVERSKNPFSSQIDHLT